MGGSTRAAYRACVRSVDEVAVGERQGADETLMRAIATDSEHSGDELEHKTRRAVRGAQQKAGERALRRGATRAVGNNKAKNNNRPRPALQRPSPADLALLHRSLPPSPASLLPATSVYERRSRSSFPGRPIPPRHPSSVFDCLLVIPSSRPARDGVLVPVLPRLPSRAVF